MQATIDEMKVAILGLATTSAPQSSTRHINERLTDPFQVAHEMQGSLDDERELEIEQGAHSTQGASSRNVCTHWDEDDERKAVEEEIQLHRDRRAASLITRMTPDEGGP